MASTLTTWSLAAETREWVGPITVLADDVAVSSFQVTVTEGGGRPTLWKTPEALEGGFGIVVGLDTDFPLRAGRKYTVWTRFTDTPEQPVARVGYIKVF